MRALFNTYPVAFDCPGGGEIQLLKTRESLEALGVEVVLYDPWRPQLDQADIVHYFSVQGGSINFCSHVKNKGLPLVISPIIWLGRDRDSYPLGEIEGLLHLSDLVLPNSRAEMQQLSDFSGLPEERFFITRNGIDTVFFSQVSGDLFRETFGINGAFLLNVANVEPRKNQLNLIRALKGTGMELVVLGNIRDKGYYEECAREGEGFVRFTGYVEHGSELQKSAYSACEAFVLPSTLETPGLSALEAAASGARVVVTSIGCTEEYFGDMVTYVNPYDTESILNGIRTEVSASRDGSLRAHMVENFTWHNTALQVREAYQKALELHGREGD
jgi:glycosyltransferase involved in cell wall biosynthesis